jgi:hypothetical protein
MQDAGDNFFLSKIKERAESQFGTPAQMLDKVRMFESWTEEFGVLFEELFPDYSSWYLKQIR